MARDKGKRSAREQRLQIFLVPREVADLQSAATARTSGMCSTGPSAVANLSRNGWQITSVTAPAKSSASSSLASSRLSNP